VHSLYDAKYCNILITFAHIVVFYSMVFKHSMDITILVVLLWFSIVHYSSLFQYFIYRFIIVPTLAENS